MATKILTYLICDICGSEHDANTYRAQDYWISLTVSYDGAKGCKDGHTELRKTHWLCTECSEQFLRFLEGTPQ